MNIKSLNFSIISAEFGVFGSLVIRRIVSFEEPITFKYKSGDYDYISFVSDQIKRILWTDYSDVEPYNRLGGLYCDGATFVSLGSAVKETPNYREFVSSHDINSHTSYGVWGYNYNHFYNLIKFGICIKTDKVEEFVSKLRQLIGK